MGKPHEQLKAWKSAMQLAKAVYQLTAGFPTESRVGRMSRRRYPPDVNDNRSSVCNLRRKALRFSALQNGANEYLHFIGIARGSLAELETQLQLAAMLDFVKPDHAAFDLTDRTGKLLTGLHKKWNAQ